MLESNKYVYSRLEKVDLSKPFYCGMIVLGLKSGVKEIFFEDCKLVNGQIHCKKQSGDYVVFDYENVGPFETKFTKSGAKDKLSRFFFVSNRRKDLEIKLFTF